MKITILTLFPKIFDNFLETSIIKNIIKDKIATIKIVNFRDYSKQKNKQVDDYAYGGGAGMVLMLQPLVDAIKDNKTKNTKVILLSPQGIPYKQQHARTLAKEKDIILIAGHYEGFDERINNYVDEVISIGDYILTGGEIPAMVIVESVVRLLENGISKQSLDSESFDNNLLDYSVYTKPVTFEKYSVPEVLLSGNHKKIAEYRKEEQIKKTKKIRPDLFKK
ncbi:MAG: tRNA (guanosine(37)-N1)-methyltransferase TrmD [Mycoplasmataceae bacterium]|jgi:tRNA (guanine37-N1)-methyltransferase|nr:tRNA (guanosine(37)-N1)-methyltransferase TrmD [Mycoplasmataceae bacterium]